jgi:class 3 adenylate cyclase
MPDLGRLIEQKLHLIMLLMGLLIPTVLRAGVLEFQNIPVNHSARYFVDSSNLEASEVIHKKDQLFKSGFGVPTSMGFQEHPVWMLYEYHNDGPSFVATFENTISMTAKIDLYHYDSAFSLIEHNRSGFAYPFHERAFPFRNSVNKATLKNGQNFILIRFQTENPLVTDTVMRRYEGFTQYAMNDYIFTNLCIGGILLIAIINFFIYLNVKDITYLSYSLYSFVQYFHSMAVQGLAIHFDMFRGHETWLMNNFLFFMIDMCIVSSILFGASFLNLKIYMKKLNRFLSLQMYVAIISAIGHLFYNSNFQIIVSLLSIGIGAPIILYAGLVASYRRYKPAYFYTAAWIMLLLATVKVVLEYLGFVNYNPSTLRMLLMSAVCEGAIFSLALGYRVSTAQKEKEKEKRKKDHYVSQMKKVFHSHQLTMMENGNVLEDTMPTGPAEACVIAFDVASSSKIGHVENHEFFESVMKKCQELMNQNYEPEKLIGNAFRIKEMGDGFLCSVGFPFKCPGSMSMEATAYSLAQEFVNVFAEEVRKHFGHDNFHCGVGIAKGPVVGYFPKSGTKEYDLFGNGIIHATRYESIRKEILKGRGVKNIIILQSGVFEGLSEAEKSEFSRVDLEKSNVKIRDDDTAKVLYYRILDSKDDIAFSKAG